MIRHRNLLTYLFLALCFCAKAQTIDLSGRWGISLEGASSEKSIYLPGTTDDASLGIADTLSPLLRKPQLLHLTRKHSFEGKAYYTQEVEIPRSWTGKNVFLFMERVLWKSSVWVDGKKVEKECNSLIAPHEYDLTSYLTPGVHLLKILVDNTKQYEDVSDLTHAYTNHTQIRWNGIIGEIYLESRELNRISDVEIHPVIADKSIRIRCKIQNLTGKKQKGVLDYETILKKTGVKVLSFKEKVILLPGENILERQIALGDDAQLWSEFTPVVYQQNVRLEADHKESHCSADFGLREFAAEGVTLKNNGLPVFLRGTLECCIFPLTGYPPMTAEGWQKVFKAAREWGLNHLRFHSWCPPKAAFEVADQMGFYLQVELPIWSSDIGRSQEMTTFLQEEAGRILREYGNHPSFCMMSLGNELEGDMSVLQEMTRQLRKEDSRRLYTTTSFTFKEGFGRWPDAMDDFFVSQWTKKGWVRGQGVFNSELPTFDKDYSASVEGMACPLITHEIGQYAVYPDIKEINKYTGVLKPLNFIAVKNDLNTKGMLGQADKLLASSGKLAALLYKEEIERALKTPGISGYQLLDLHDFPGQGTALVGLLNAFWESKGVFSAEEFRQFSSPVVPLLRFPKAVYLNKESFRAAIEVSNYSSTILKNQTIEWKVADTDGKLVGSGSTKVDILNIGHNSGIGEVLANLDQVSEAKRLVVSLRIRGTSYENRWNIWVYPDSLTLDYDQVKYTRSFDEARKWLGQGERVLYNPDWKNVSGIEGKFVPVFWSPVHFPKQAGTMGMICDVKHPALKEFPTESHTDWQWWDLHIRSTTMNVDSLQGGKSLVSMIDNFTNNRRLSSVYEGAVGKGKLIVTTIDLSSDLKRRPVARQLLYALLGYMNSASFTPDEIVNFEKIKSFLKNEKMATKSSAESIY